MTTHQAAEVHQQTGEGTTFFIILALLCITIFVTAFSLTFFRKADTGDKAAH